MHKYEGTELELFREAANWKSYFGGFLRRWISGDVIEVGAGIGGSTRHLLHEGVRSWRCVEPDQRFRDSLLEVQAQTPMNIPLFVESGTLSVVSDPDADCILYIDVLEHIAEDREELQRACSHLRVGGRIVILAPAHQALYSPFDSMIGHHRRYGRKTIHASIPQDCRLEGIWFLDSVGALLSFGNRALLRQKLPSPAQIRWWDTRIIPVSRHVDRFLRYRFGKSVVWVLTRG